MKIVHTELIEEWAKVYLEKLFVDEQCEYSSALAQDLAGDEAVEVLTVFVNSRVTSEVLNKFPNLKLIVTRSTGYDHIDLVECEKRNIMVCNVPSYGERTVAEYTFALLLTISRKVYSAIRRVHEEGKFRSDGLKGFDLAGKTLGVVGTGRIGCHVIQIANGFDMNVVAYDPFPKPDLEKTCAMKYVTLDQLLQDSDALTLHVPYMPSTHHLLNSDNMRKIKRGAVLINTARGALIETVALVDALTSGVLAGAALDVLEEEGYVGEERKLTQSTTRTPEQMETVLVDHQLMQFPNVYITPHNAFNTQEALERILQVTRDNVVNFQSKAPSNEVKLLNEG